MQRLLLAAALMVGALAGPGRADEIVLREALVIGDVGTYGRSPTHTDAVEALIVAGDWAAPAAGDGLELPDGETRTWTTATADDKGWLTGPAFRSGWASFTVESDRDRVMMLHARGHSRAYVNEVPRAGDPYNTGFVRLPVRLRAGSNDLLFRVRRGRLWARLSEPAGGPVALDTADLTLPDLIAGEDWGVRGAVLVVNASGQRLDGLTITAAGDGLPTRETMVPSIAPMTVRKVPFWCGGAVDPQRGSCAVRLRLSGDGGVIDEATVRLAVKEPGERHTRTFVSEIDRSVQYYAVTPMAPGAAGGSPAGGPALFLSLHGAGVKAPGQAAAYRPKDWGHLVAPTNRRPFGFDWEDWGRLDAMEAMADAMARYDIDPRRVYLTGHSMGGHGVWHLGATFPDRFAAIGPSAGWVSFWSYTGAAQYEDADPIEAILRRAAAPSDTATLSRNHLHHGVYILHGEKDDNVPVGQAHFMNEHLGAFHPDLVYHEQPGAGHWWGNQCVDWPPMFEFFRRHTRPEAGEVDHVEFVTANPGISAWSHWAGIEAQVEIGVPSAVVIDLDRAGRHFETTTDNVARLSLRLEHLSPDEPVSLTLDGQTLPDVSWPAETKQLWLALDDDTWTVSGEPPWADLKGPHRFGPFKDAFRHRMVFVYGTAGTPRENDWAFHKTRYDAETFRYRGNGSIDVIPDTDLDSHAGRDRNVILYGNAETNAAWGELLGAGPVQVRRGSITIGEKQITGDDLACLLIRPRPGSPTACVAAVSGTGITGLRVTDALPYFVSGVAYPDCIVIGAEMLARGTAGVRAAGFFGNDWSVETGDFAWRP